MYGPTMRGLLTRNPRLMKIGNPNTDSGEDFFDKFNYFNTYDPSVFHSHSTARRSSILTEPDSGRNGSLRWLS